MKHKLIIPLSMLLMVGCDNPSNSPTNTNKVENSELDYSTIEQYRIGWEDILSIDDSRYMVYFYSEYCGYCKLIKQEILSYFLLNIDEMYFVNAKEEPTIYKPNDGLLIGAKRIEDFYIFGTPFLVEVNNHTVINWYAGVESIRLYIDTRIEQ